MPTTTTRLKLLLIDDDPSIVIALGARLFRYFEVASTNEPTEAVKLAASFMPDVILCDINMPGMNGDEVAFELSQDRRVCRIPLLYLSGSVPHGEITELGGSFGGLPAISKTASTEQLLQAIRSVMA